VLGDQHWLKLLDQRRIDHPKDVLTPYRDMIEHQVLNSAGKHRYRRAVALLSALRDAYATAGGRAAFTTYLENLRTRRPAFIKTLDAATL
jgi:hypothetical protein